MDAQPLYSADDIDLATRMVMAEAGNQGSLGKAAVAHVMKNRLDEGGYGDNLTDVITSPKQFTPWATRQSELLGYAPDSPAYQQTRKIVEGVLGGGIPDMTNGATHFANVGASDPVNQRGWIANMAANGSAVKIGAHTFGRPQGRPGRKTVSADLNPSDFEVVSKPEAALDPKDFEVVSQPEASFEARFSPGGDPVRPALRSALEDKAKALASDAQDAKDKATLGSDDNPLLAGALAAGQTVGLNIPGNVGAGLATLFGKAGVPGYSPRSFSENYERFRQQQDALARQNPVSSAVGTGVGMGAALATGFAAPKLLPSFAAAEGAPLIARAGAGALTAGAYGGASDLIGTHDPEHALGAATVSAAFGAGATPLIEAGANVLAKTNMGQRLLGLQPPVGVLDPVGHLTPEAVQALRDAGLDPAQVGPALQQRLQELSQTKGITPAVAREANAADQGIQLTAGQALQDATKQQWERGAANGAMGQDARNLVEPAFKAQDAALAARKAELGDQFSGGAPVASPREAAEMVASRAAGASNLAEQVAQNAEQQGQAALAGARLPNFNDTDAGAVVAQGVRTAEQAARQARRQAYDQASAHGGTFEPGTFQQVGQSVLRRLGPEYPIDPVLTPAASRAVADLDNMVGLAGPSPDMRAVDQVRKRLVSYRTAARANPTDRRAMDGVLHAYDDHVEEALANGLFSGSDQAIHDLQAARAAHRQYAQTYRPQGPGDDVGRAMQQIVDRDARPSEVANFLYGASQTGIGQRGLSQRLADRLANVLGEDSPHWAAIQQGLMARAINGADMNPRAISGRITDLLGGRGRDLAQRVLTAEQTNALRAYQRGVERAQATRERVPQWVSDLGRKNFEPEAVITSLFGRSGGTPPVTSPDFARAVRGFFGDASPEVGALRQAGWQMLTAKPEGVADFGPQAIGNRIGDFLNGKGRSLAHSLYTPEQRAEMARFAQTMKDLTPLPNTLNPSGTAGMLGRAAETAVKHHRAILNMLGFAHGGFAGLGATAAINAATKALGDARTVGRAAQAVAGAPRATRPPVAAPDVSPALGLGVGQRRASRPD